MHMQHTYTKSIQTIYKYTHCFFNRLYPSYFRIVTDFSRYQPKRRDRHTDGQTDSHIDMLIPFTLRFIGYMLVNLQIGAFLVHS